jgi:autotransporter-associated beta strand protein
MTINPSAPSAITIGSGGITKSTTQLILIGAPVTLDANQIWNIGTGNSLRMSGALTTGGNTLLIQGAGLLNLRGSNTTYGSDVTIAANVTADQIGASITLGGSNTFDTLTITRGSVSGATIGDFGVASNFGDGGASTAIAMGTTGGDAGTFRYTGNTASSNRTFNRAGLSGNNTGLVNAILEVATAGQTLTLSGNLSSGSSNNLNPWQFGGAGNLRLQGNIVETAGNGTTAIIKADSGTVTVEAANLFEGGTTVNGGTLLVNNASGSGLGNGTVTVGAATLGGNGSFTGAVTINSGGTLAPGTSIETLGSGALTLNTGSTFAYEVDSGVALAVGGDLQKVTGDLALNGVVTLTFADLDLTPTAFAVGTTFTLINYSGTWNNGLFTFGAGTVADGGTFSAGLNLWELDYNASTGGVNFPGEHAGGNFVNVTAVIPEPSTFLLLATGGLATLVFRRRRA